MVYAADLGSVATSVEVRILSKAIELFFGYIALAVFKRHGSLTKR